LGVRTYDGAAWGRSGTWQFHYFHLLAESDSPARWRHFELVPSDGSTEPIEFELFWVQFPDDVPDLIGPQGELLQELHV
jgi:hypothetical protein